MKQIIVDIKTRLASKVPVLKYIAKNWGQLNFFTREGAPPVRFPCTLVNINSGQFSNIGAQIQEGLLQVVITIACAPASRVSSKAPDQMQDNELFIYELEQQVYKALHGWAGSANYSALIRVSFSESIREDGIQLLTVTYTTNWQDTDAMPVFPTVDNPVPKIVVGLKR